MTFKRLFFLFLVIFLFLAPLVVYLYAYNPRDCDDKSVHYFSALYSFADQHEQQNVDKLVEAALTKYSDHTSHDRTTFRMQTTGNYPLANVFIYWFDLVYQDYSQSVKYGLFASTVLAYFVFTAVASSSKWGVVNTLLAANFASLLFKPFFEGWMFMWPFVSYVPRGIAAFALIPLITSMAERKWGKLIITLGTVFALHIGLGLVVLVLVAAVWLMRMLINVLKKGKITNASFVQESYIYSSCFLVMILAVRYGFPWVLEMFPVVENLGGYFDYKIMRSLSDRMFGLLVINVIFLILQTFEVISRWVVQKPFLRSSSYLPYLWVVPLLALSLLIYKRRAFYQIVLAGGGGFQALQCQEVEILSLPEQAEELDIREESSFFVSLGHYLRKLEQR